MVADGVVPDAQMERQFMSNLDSEAARVMPKLEQNMPVFEWSSIDRSAWTRFVWAQMMRHPADIAQIKSFVGQSWEKEYGKIQSTYDKERTAEHPERFEGYLNEVEPLHADWKALDTTMMLMDHAGTGHIINNMFWRVLDFSGCGVDLVTSDRPVWMTVSLLEPDALIVMPIGPTKLFVAANDLRDVKAIRAMNRRKYAKEVNKLMVQHAIKFVFGADEKLLPFVQKHFATKRHSTLMERLARMEGYTVLDNYN